MRDLHILLANKRSTFNKDNMNVGIIVNGQTTITSNMTNAQNCKSTLSMRMQVPKSASFRWPWASSSMLSGFTSLHSTSTQSMAASDQTAQ